MVTWNGIVSSMTKFGNTVKNQGNGDHSIRDIHQLCSCLCVSPRLSIFPSQSSILPLQIGSPAVALTSVPETSLALLHFLSSTDRPSSTAGKAEESFTNAERVVRKAEENSSASWNNVANISKFSKTAYVNSSPTGIGATGLATLPNLEAVKRTQELAARLGFRPDPHFAALINAFLGREIDELGNVVNVTKPSNLSKLKVNINKQKKDAFEILKPVLDVDPESNPHFDARVGINKTKLLPPQEYEFLVCGGRKMVKGC
ncbi:hypothetical protein VNO78_18777 [Psophocarpus tetragonolobus]|uniref:Uncharacterized protein n=1 Tax=Psophocarpus tetragonolobus TaxID=3891 RepID=A0AAN9S6X4_PSOTE